MKAYIEHINLTVPNISKTLEFLQVAFPEGKVRGEGGREDGRPWIHFGDEVSYLAISQGSNDRDQVVQGYDAVGFNHLAFVVEDVGSLAKRLRATGYEEKPLFEEKIEARHRVYFIDGNGFEFEFVQYFTEEFGRSNEYL